MAMVAAIPYRTRWLKLTTLGMSFSAVTVTCDDHHFLMSNMPDEYYALYLAPLLILPLVLLARWAQRGGN